MSELIQFLSIQSQPNRKNRPTRHQVEIWLRVAHTGYGKQVTVHWQADAAWSQSSADYSHRDSDGAEFWRARFSVKLRPRSHCPGLTFACRTSLGAAEYWDNNQGQDYYHHWREGWRIHPDLSWLRLPAPPRLGDGQTWLSVHIALNPETYPGVRPTLHWSADGWRTQRRAEARLLRDIHPRLQIWRARLKIGVAFRIEYAIAYTRGRNIEWDNNRGRNYRLQRKPLAVMILNLHCYQEDQQDAKFSRIAQAINELDVDVVCLQEAAEPWNHGHGEWNLNAANIINQRLPRPFHIAYDWSHLGFEQYREGVAILSRYPLRHIDAGYVSDSADPYDIHSRKVITARLRVPYIGEVQVFSVHLSWWENGFANQFRRLAAWSDSLNQTPLQGILLCGDFNISADSAAYRLVTQDFGYRDQYLTADRQGSPAAYREDDAHWPHAQGDAYRIDYIFSPPANRLNAAAARPLFTDHDYGRVSDHPGYLFTFVPA